MVSNGERLAELSEKAANSQDAATLQVLKTMDSIEAKTQQLKTSLQSLYTSTGVQNLFKGILDYGNNIITTFTKMPTVFNLPIVAIAKFGTQFFTLANVVTNAFGLIKARLTAQSRILQGQMTADAKMGEAARVQISEQEAESIFEVLTQEGANFEQLQNRLDAIQAQHGQQRIKIAQNEANGVSKAMAQGGLIASAAGSALSMISAGMGDSTQGQRTAKGLTDILGTALSGVGTGLMIGGIPGAVVGTLTTLPGLITGISTIVETAAEKEERLKKAVEETNNVYLQRKDEAKTLEEQIEKLEELEKAQNDSVEAKAEFVELSNQMTNQHPELITAIDSEGNAIISLSESYNLLADARKEAIKAAQETAGASYEQANSAYEEAKKNADEKITQYVNNASNLVPDSIMQSSGEASLKEILKGGLTGSGENLSNEELLEIASNYIFSGNAQGFLAKLFEKGQFNMSDLSPEDGDEMKKALGDYFNKYNSIIQQNRDNILQASAQLENLNETSKKAVKALEIGDSEELKKILLNDDYTINEETLRSLQKSTTETQDTYTLNLINNLIELSRELGVSAQDAVKTAKIQEAAIRSGITRVSSEAMRGMESDYFEEMSGAMNFINEAIIQEAPENMSEEEFNKFLETVPDLVEKYDEQLASIWKNLGSSFKRDKFNQLIENSKNYSSNQMAKELESLGLEVEQITNIVTWTYGEETQSIANFNAAVKKRLENNNSKLANTLESFLSIEMGEADYSAVLDKYDQLQEMISGGAITDDYADTLLKFYKDLLSKSNNEAYSADREQIQSAIQELDLTSLESVNAFIEAMTEIGFLDAKTAEALRNAVPVNLNTEVSTYVEKISSEMEDFESALSKATGGMKYKDAATIAAKMGASVDDFRQVGDKFFIDDLDALEKAYFDTSNDLVEGLHGKIGKLSEGLNSLGDFLLNDNTFSKDWFDAKTYFSSDYFRGRLSDVLQNVGVNVNLESLQLESTYNEWLEVSKETEISFIDYLIQQLISSLEEAEKVQKVINPQKAEGYLAQGNFTKFLENLDLDKEQRSRAQEAFNEGNLDEVFAIIPQYADKITETLKKINQDIYNRMTSETNSDNWIKYDDSNKDLFSDLARKGLISSDRRKDQDGNFWYKLEEITDANIKDYYDTITNDATLTSSEKAATRAKATNKVFNESIDKYLQDAFKNSDKISQEIYENLKQAVIDSGNSVEEFENYFTQEAGSNELQLTDISGLIALLQQFGITIQQATIDAGNEAVEKTIDSFLKEVSNATSLVTKGTTSQADEQSFVEKYNKLMKEIGDSSRITSDEAFIYDTELKADTLNNDVFKKYIEATKTKLKNLGWSEERINQYINDLTNKTLAEAVDIDSFLKAENREVGSQAYNKLADQMRDYYSTIYDSETLINSIVEKRMQNMLSGGNAAVQNLVYWAKKEGTEVSSSDVEQAYRAEISQLENAFDQLSYGVGSLISGQAVDILEAAGYGIDRIEGTDSAVIEFIGNIADAYEKYYGELKKTGEATIAALNEAYAKVLETRDDSDVISALGDAASMTYTRLGEILASKGLKLEEQILDGIVESIGGGKVRITNFDRFATEIMGWTDIDKNSEEYISAFKTYNDSLIEMNRKAERNIVEEVQALEDAQVGDQINLTQLVSGLGTEVTKVLAASLKDSGALLENGILTLEQNANIPAIIQNLSETAAENGLILQDSMAQLADTLNNVLENYASLINNGIEGSLTNTQAQQLQVQAQSLGYVGKLNFSRTVEGLKLSEESARKLYEHLRSVDSLQAKLVFDKLYESITDSHQGLKTISGTMAEIEKTQKQITENERKINALRAAKENSRADQIEKENNKLKAQLSLYEQIRDRQRDDASSYDFMGQDLPEAFKGAENYWNSVGSAFKAMNEAGESGTIAIQDFYNIVNEMNNLAAISGNKLVFMGKTLDGSAEAAASLIEKGFGALSNVDGSGVVIDLKKLGVQFKNGAADMQSGFQGGIKAMAQSQIDMLDAMIALMETVVAMQKLGEVDTDENGILSVGEIFNDDGSFTELYDGVRKYLANSEELKPLLDNLKVNGISLRKLLDENQDAWREAGISEDEYAKIMTAFYQASISDNYDLENLISSVLDVLSGTGQVFSYYDKESKIETVIDASGRTYTVNWNSEEDKKRIYEAFEKAGYNKRPSDEEIREILNRGQAGKSKDQKEVFAYQLTYGLVTECKVDGKTKYQDSNGGLHDTIEEAVIENAFIKQKGEAKGERKTIEASGKTSGYQQDYLLESGLSYSLTVGVDGKEEYSTIYKGKNGDEVITGNTYQEMIDTLLDRATSETYDGKKFSELAPEEQIKIKRKLNLEVTPEILFTGADGKEYDPSTNPETQQKLQTFLNQSHDKIQQALEQNDDGSFTITLDGGKLTVKAENENEAITKVQQAVDPLIVSISAGIKSAFTSDNTIGDALITAITTALTKVSFDGQKFTIPDIPVTAEKITVDTSKATPVFRAITQENIDAAKDWIESKKSSLTVSNVPVTVEKATYSAPTETDASALIDAATTTGKDVNAGLAAGMSDTTEITEKARGNINSIIGAMNTAAGVQMAGGGSTKTAQTGEDIARGLAQGLTHIDEAVANGKTLVQQVIDAIQAYLDDHPLTVTANVATGATKNTEKPKLQQTSNSSSTTPQTIKPIVDLSGITALQNAINALSSAGTAAAAELGQMNANLINSTVKATNFEEALSNISDNGKNKADDFSAALNAIKQDGIDRTSNFKDAVNAIEANGVNNARAFKEAVNNTESSGASNAKAYKEAVNDTGPGGANNASAYRYAVNSTYESGAKHAERFRDALNSIGDKTLKVEVNVTTSGGGQTSVKGAGTYSWSWAKGNALAGGKTLMGELGPELVVSHGRYFLVGQNGPEMVNLDEDAIVFNHLQTKKLIEKGKISSHGTPVTNERKATSMATGNFEGPAFASASEVLAMLKQLREMWRSLLKATAKDIGAMAGKAGKTSKGSGADKTADETKDTEKYTAGIESNVERWYNWLQAIEATQYKINKLTKEYNILEKEGVSTQERLNNLRQQYKLRQENKDTKERLAKEQKAYRDDVIDTANQGLMSAFYQADKETGQVYLANDDAFQKFLKRQQSKGLAAGELSSVLAENGSIRQETSITRGLNKKEREAKAEKVVKHSYGRQNKVPSYLRQYYKDGTLIEGKEEEARNAAAEEFKSSKYTKKVKTTREIRTGFDFMAELQATDEAGNLIHNAEDQLALIKEMGLFTEDLLVGIDQETEGWEAQVVQRFYDKVEEDKESIESLTESIRDQELAALDEASAMQEINDEIRELTKPIRVVSEGLEKWYEESQKILAIQQEINKVLKKQSLLEKDQKINGEEIYEDLKDREKLLEEGKAEKTEKKQKKEQERQEDIEKAQKAGIPFEIDEKGRAVYSSKKWGTVNGYGSVATSYRDLVYTTGLDGKQYETDTEGHYRDSEGKLRDAKTHKEVEGTFGQLAGEVVSGEVFDFANKTFEEINRELNAVDEYGKPKYTQEQKYQVYSAMGLGELMRYDESGQEIYDGRGEITKEQMSKGVEALESRVKDTVSGINKETDEIDQLELDILDADSELLDIQQTLIDNQIEVENMVKDAVIQEHQDAIDTKKELKDALDDAASRTIDGLREGLEQERAMYDKAENQKQLDTLQRQLEVAQRSGASLSKIQGLQDQVASAQKDMYFTEREDLIDDIESSMQREIEALDTQISIMEATLEFQKENGLLWAEINQILAGTPASIIDYITQKNPDHLSQSETERKTELVSIGDKVTKYAARRDDDKKDTDGKFDQLAKLIQGTQQEEEEKGEEEVVEPKGGVLETKVDEPQQTGQEPTGQDQPESEVDVEVTFEDGFVPEMEEIGSEVSAKLDLGTKLTQGKGFVWDDAWDTNRKRGYNASKEAYGIKPVLLKAQKLAGGKLSNEDILEAFKARYIRQIANEQDTPAQIAKQWNSWNDETIKKVLKAELKKLGKTVPKFERGGDIDFTGLARVDGTKNEPEHIFNFEQMEALRAHLLNGVDVTQQAISGLSEALNQMPNVNTYNNINNTTDSGITINTLEFHMEVSEIANDYDARRAGEQAMNEIVRIARKSGTRSLSRR